MTKASLPESTSIRQALQALQSVEDQMRHLAPLSATAAARAAERIARILAGALAHLDRRLTLLEAYQQEVAGEEIDYGAHEEERNDH